MTQPPTRLPTFPVTDDVLDTLEHSLDSCLTFDDEEGNPLPSGEGPRRVGADFGLPQLLNFYSGYDSTKSMLIQPGRDESDLPEWERGRGGWADAAIYEYPGPIYSRDDVIRALITEVRRLR